MKKISEYEIIEVINETQTSIIARGRKNNSEKTVIIKLLKSENTSEDDIARLRQEHEIIKSIESSGVIHTYEIVEHENSTALILEDFNGVPLQQKIEVIQNDFRLFLNIAIDIANTLGEIHQSNIIHKDINPSNIILSSDNSVVKILDFGISSILSKDTTNTSNIIKGTLKYISPEQTGRMNRMVDYRTDYYSLGITFYEMLTGTVPFNLQDPMELIHAHIARKPVAPINVKSDIPAAVSNIIMKLMAKTGEDRYQSAYSLVKDLKTCRKQFIQTGKIQSFQIAQNDIPHVYVSPQAIVGRDNEIAKLKNCFENVCNGNCEIVLVEGESGIGKSTLINELYKPVSEAHGFFIFGKYNQFRKNVPYSALLQAFKEFANQILSEGPEKKNEWKNRLTEALGLNGQVLIDNIPEFEQIIGKQPAIKPLEPEQEQNRYRHVFKNLFKIMSSKEAPLTLFLDDLQWVDLPSIGFIEMMIKDTDIESLLLICAYRDSEVEKGHPFIMLTEKFTKYNRPVERFSLAPLKVRDVNKFVVTALHCDEKKSLPLAEIVHVKTNGNPFFVNQYLLDLYKKKFFYFKPESGWEWNINDIANLQITDNVVELMSTRITELSDETVYVLKLSACIGNRFDLVTLSILAKKTIDETLKNLLEAINNGLVIFNKKRYRFVHNKIHEAAYLLTSEDEKKEFHLSIARMVLNNTHEEDFQNKILYIVDQYDKGIDLITDNDELKNLAMLNLKAGIKAKKSVAYKAAAEYFKTGLSIIKSLSTNYWETYYDLSLNLHSEMAQTMMYQFDHEKMDKHASCVLKNAVNIFDKVNVYETLILNYIAQNNLEQAVQTGLSVTRQMGINFPKRFLKFHIAVRLTLTRIRLIGVQPEDFVKLHEAKDSKTVAQLQLIAKYVTAAYRSKVDYVPLFALKGLMLTKNFGNNPASPLAMVGYGLLHCFIGQHNKGIEYGQAALKIIEKFNYNEEKTKVYVSLVSLILHWQKSPRDLETLLMKAYNSGLECGDHLYASLCLTISAYHNYYTALELVECETLLNKYAEIIKELGQNSDLISIRIFLQVCINIRSTSDSFDILTSEYFDEKTTTPLSIDSFNTTNRYYHYFLGSNLSYLAGNFKRADAYINKSKKELGGVLSSFVYAVFYFYNALIKLAVYEDSGWWRKKYIKLQIGLNLLKMKKFADTAPMNYLNKYYLVKAEFANINGQNNKASDYYYKAIETAAENGFTQEKGMAHELAANFYLKIGHKKTAIRHLEKAKKSFEKWGANAKVKQLEKKYSDYFEQSDDNTGMSEKSKLSTTKTFSDTRSLDFSSVMKSSQAFSSITDLKILLMEVLVISMENAGAQKGALILENNGELFIEAEGSIDSNYSVLNSIPLNDSNNLCIPIIKYVLRRKKSIVLNDASNEGDYVSDLYIVQNKPKSILAIPVIHQNKFTGILYLENNLATRAFTPNRVEILQILSTQAAISIKIARQSNELSNTNKNLLEAKNIAENANKAKTGFLANMAHEFRTPLNGIEGELQLLKDIETGHSMEHIDNISSSSKRLMASINKVIDFSELENGTFVPEMSVFNIAKRIEEIQDVIKNDIKLKNLNFNLTIDSTLPELIEGDEKRITRMILSLLENSIKFTVSGSISLDISYNTDSQLEIIVVDTGEGIAEDKLNKLFNAFGQYEQDLTFTKHFEGLGLGLSITAKIVRLMNGTITATSIEGEGSTFSISIPAKRIDNPKKETVDLSTLNALIVEDNRVNAVVLTSFLKKLGLKSDVAVDGKLGVEAYSSGNYNLIFMDVQMPVMNGLEATKVIRAAEACKNTRTPIIGVTANAKKQECIDAGMDAFIQKPVNMDVISEAIINVTEKAL